MRTHHPLTCLLVVALLCPQSFGWSAAGHKIIASISYQRLPGDQRTGIANLLRQHPRFAEDFARRMPEGLTDAEQDEWLFQQAAVWPDIARGFREPDKERYNHPTWHYINQPLYLDTTDRDALHDSLPVNLDTTVPADDAARLQMNVIQAIAYSKTIAYDAGAPAADRAVALCWLLHLVGDIHQPLHSTALFSQRQFPEGDRSGNSIRTAPIGNLHSLWDGFPGRDAEYREARNRAIELIHDADLSRLGEEAAMIDSVEAWTEESHELCVSDVYTPEVLAFVRGLSPEAVAGRGAAVTLSEEYLKRGGQISTRRAVQGGYRLERVLRSVP